MKRTARNDLTPKQIMEQCTRETVREIKRIFRRAARRLKEKRK